MGTETHQHQGSEISQRKEKGAASPAQPSLPSKGWRTALSSLIGGFLSLFKHTVLIIKASSRSASHQNDRTKRGRLPKAAGGRENTKQKRPGAGLPTPREAQESLGFPRPARPQQGAPSPSLTDPPPAPQALRSSRARATKPLSAGARPRSAAWPAQAARGHFTRGRTRVSAGLRQPQRF